MEIVDTTTPLPPSPPPPPPPPPPPCYNNNNDDLSAAVAKGKRTKRYRPHSPPNIPFVITPPAGEYHTTATAFSATSEESTTTEEEDTARCLILLARGHNFSIHVSNDNRDLKHDATSKIRQADVGGGACMYACKTCDRVFSSFQALGGHRASHKKPKNDKIRPPFFSDHEEDSPPHKKFKMIEFGNVSTTVTAAAAASSPRTHECSYCGAEFPSGQALGGHMRRHRTDPDAKKPPRNNGLSLDLNLPAPEDENPRLGQSSEKLVLLTALIN